MYERFFVLLKDVVKKSFNCLTAAGIKHNTVFYACDYGE